MNYVETIKQAAAVINETSHHDDWTDVIEDAAVEIADHFGLVDVDQVISDIWAEV